MVASANVFKLSTNLTLIRVNFLGVRFEVGGGGRKIAPV